MISALMLAASLGFSSPAQPAVQLAEPAAERQPGGRLRDRLRERTGERGGRQRQRDRHGMDMSSPADERISYGNDDRQRILLYAAPPPAPNVRRRPPPLAVYIHGGGWENGEPEMVASKPSFYKGQGWAFASIGYRMLPDTPVEEQARDIGRALAKLREDANRLGYDGNRILLTGHSAGAHLAALVASDPQYAGSSFSAIKGVIPIDGACYDVPAQITQSRFMAQRTYIPAFGTDPARQRALSPTFHAGGEDAPDWLILYTSARDDAKAQSEALAAALRGNGKQSATFVVPFEGQNPLEAHGVINRDFGTAGYAANDAVLELMERVAR